MIADRNIIPLKIIITQFHLEKFLSTENFFCLEFIAIAILLEYIRGIELKYIIYESFGNADISDKKKYKVAKNVAGNFLTTRLVLADFLILSKRLQINKWENKVLIIGLHFIPDLLIAFQFLYNQ